MQTFIGGLVVGVLLSIAWFYGNATWNVALTPNQQATASSTAPLSAAALVTATSTSAALAVSDQPAGGSVTIESVSVPPPGVWAAVREVNAGTLGNVLGAARAGGPRTNVVVPLLRATMPGRTYAVELYRASVATSSVFDLTSASVYVALSSGKPVIVYFNTVN